MGTWGLAPAVSVTDSPDCSLATAIASEQDSSRTESHQSLMASALIESSGVLHNNILFQILCENTLPPPSQCKNPIQRDEDVLGKVPVTVLLCPVPLLPRGQGEQSIEDCTSVKSTARVTFLLSHLKELVQPEQNPHVLPPYIVAHTL